MKIKGAKQVLANLNKEIEEKRLAAKKGIVASVLYVKGESMKEVPVMTSNLKNSAYSDVKVSLNGVSGEVGYGVSYAPFVHENKRAGKTGGVSPKGVRYKPPKGSTEIAYAESGKWKFLEEPLFRSQAMVKRLLIRYAKK